MRRLKDVFKDGGWWILKRCPECATYYKYHYDHDSESGVGYGWTDEILLRLNPDEARDELAAIAARLEKQVGELERLHREGKTRGIATERKRKLATIRRLAKARDRIERP